MCPFFSRSQKELLKHLNKKHKFSKKFIVHCCRKGCGRTFKSYNTFGNHFWRKHKNDTVQDHELVNVQYDEDTEFNEDDNESSQSVPKKRINEAAFLLNLKVGHKVSQTGLEDIMQTTKDLFSERLEAVRDAVKDQICDMSSLEDVLKDDLFEGLETEYLQEKMFQEHMGYVKPKPVKLGAKLVTHTKEGKQNFVQKDVCGYIVPFKEQLTAFLSQPEVASELQNPTGKVDDFYRYDVQDGSYYQSHPLVKEHGEQTLIFSLFADDFEIVNPIGSHRKKHKVTAFYWTLLNVPAHLRSKLSYIQLAAIVKANDLKRFGSKNLLADFTEAMIELEKGMKLNINNKNGIYHGLLLMVQGDTLASQQLGGFKEGVGGAQKPCRTCEVNKGDLHESRTSTNFPLREEQEHRDRVQYLGTLSKPAHLYWSKKHGVNGKGLLFDIPSFALTKCLVHDPMHLLLEGVLRYELSLLLTEFIEVKQYFNLKGLNQRILQYNYTLEEKRDKPQIIEKSHLTPGNAFAQSAQSMWILARNLPFLIGGLVQRGDEHWICFLLLLQITILCVSSVSSPHTAETLNHLIIWHHNLFAKIYPNFNFVPKMHYLIHLPDQLKSFGPLRNHWCMRFEGKNGFFKARRWRNFISITKSLALYHQRWMCLQMLGSGKSRSQYYLGGDDEVSDGLSVPLVTVKCWHKLQKYLIQENLPGDLQQDVFVTHSLVHHGHTYRPGVVLLEQFDNFKEPSLWHIDQIVVVDHRKFFIVHHLEILSFESHYNAFLVDHSSNEKIMTSSSLRYEWPQLTHSLNGVLYVMLQHVDDVWLL